MVIFLNIQTLYLDPWFYNGIISKPTEATKISAMSQNYLDLKTVFELQTFQQWKNCTNLKFFEVSMREIVQISECY